MYKTHYNYKKRTYSYRINDFVELDMFFWYIHENIIPQEWKKDSKYTKMIKKNKNDIPRKEKYVLI